MDPSIMINELVDVIAVFSKNSKGQSLCLPRKMKFRGRSIDLVELGLRHPTLVGKRMVHVFDVSDGTADYRLEFDAEQLTWMLVAMVGGGYVQSEP